MSARAPVALILGAGSNVGDHVGRAFAAKGYKIALAARSVKEQDSTSDKLLVRGDFADPESITSIFTKVRSQLGVPHVVIYNGMYHVFALIHKLTFNQPLLLTSQEPRHLSTFP
jgi:NAD(P)-dependent dehydrogenase (short-subunit alcohol dehydrogenase family)